MEIAYSLTRPEIVLSFLRSLASSPKLFARILIYCFLLGAVWTELSGGFSRGLTLLAAGFVLLWAIGTLCILVLFLFLTAKTAQRTMTVTERGISTTIGKLHGQVAWRKVSDVRDAGNHILIMGLSGNSFFIPDRAFGSPDQKAQFIADIRDWRNNAKPRD